MTKDELQTFTKLYTSECSKLINSCREYYRNTGISVKNSEEKVKELKICTEKLQNQIEICNKENNKVTFLNILQNNVQKNSKENKLYE